MLYYESNKIVNQLIDEALTLTAIQKEIDRIQSACSSLIGKLRSVGVVSADSKLISQVAIEVGNNLKASTPTVSGDVLTIPAGYIPEELTFNIGESMYSTFTFMKPRTASRACLEVIVRPGGDSENTEENTTIYRSYEPRNGWSLLLFDKDSDSWIDCPAEFNASQYDNATVVLDLGRSLSSGRWIVDYKWVEAVDRHSVIESGSIIHPSTPAMIDVAGEVGDTFDDIGELLDELNVEVI